MGKKGPGGTKSDFFFFQSEEYSINIDKDNGGRLRQIKMALRIKIFLKNSTFFSYLSFIC